MEIGGNQPIAGQKNRFQKKQKEIESEPGKEAGQGRDVCQRIRPPSGAEEGQAEQMAGDSQSEDELR